MTEPTDAEIESAWIEATGSSILPYQDDMLAFARAVLAKWGTPSAVAGEPVMWAYQYSDGSWHDASATEHSAGMKPLYPAPQPTQAQAIQGVQWQCGPQASGFTAPQADSQPAPQQPCPTCVALARTVMLDQVSFDRKPDCYGIRQITDDESVEEWEDIRTSPDVAREEANDMMATGRGEIYEVVPLWTTPQPSPTPQADSQPARDERDDFEKVFPLPSGCIRVGTGYASTGYSNWAAHTHCELWKGWRARAALAPADSVTAPAATVIKKGADRQWMSERLGHLPDGIYSLYLAPPTQAADSVLEDAAQVEIDLFNDLNRIYGNTLTAYAKEMCRLGYRKTNAARAAQEGKSHG